MKKALLSAAILSLALAGCSNEEGSLSSVPEGTPIKVNASVGEMETRAGYSPDNTPKGFYLRIENKNEKAYSYYAWMSYDDATSEWKSYKAGATTTAMPIYWAGDDEPVDVTAATFSDDEMAELGVMADQTSAEGFNTSDRLAMKTASVPCSYTGIDVALTHLMAKLEVEIDLDMGKDLTANPVTDFIVSGTELKGACAAGTFAITPLSTSAVGDVKAYTDDDMFTKTSATQTAKVRYEAILLPQTVEAGKFKVSFKLDGTTYNWTVEKAVTLDPNTRHTLSLKMNGGRLTLNKISVDVWGPTEEWNGGLVDEEKVLTVTAAGQLTEDMITAALNRGKKLIIDGPLNETDLKTLGNYTANTITYLDLTKADGDASDFSKMAYKLYNIMKNIETFKMPEGMTSISGNWFSQFAALKSVTLPEKLQSLGNYAFGTCKKLKQVTFKGNEELSIGMYAFASCPALIEVNLSEGRTTIGERAFMDCDALTKIVLPSTVSSIGGYAFYDCDALTKIDLPEGLTSIGEYAFACSDGLKQVNLPSTVTSIANRVFENCSALTEVNLSEGLTSIGTSAFNHCDALTKIDLPEGLTTIGEYAFGGCRALKKVDLPSTVTSIGKYAFANCIALTEITIPSKITSVGDYVFNGCTALKNINLPEGLTSIGEFAFWGCAVTGITIPSTVTSIGSTAFADCEALAAIELPDGLQSIGSWAFQECKALKTITIPEKVTAIQANFFDGCEELTAVTFKGKISAIGEKAFQNCAKFTDLYLQGCESLPTLASDAFSGVSQKVTVHLSSDLNDKVTLDANYSVWESVATFTAN